MSATATWSKGYGRHGAHKVEVRYRKTLYGESSAGREMDRGKVGGVTMLARASLIVLALASPAWAGPDDYPAGLFEHSPLNDTPAATPKHSSPAGQAN
jgi:hypothetical protein